MKIPIQWLKEYIKIDMPPERLAERLTMAGLEVGAIEYHGKNISDVVVGKVKNIERHATKSDVFICQVDTGTKILQIVTKAQNLKVGDRVPVALHGATLPSGIRVQNRELHGVESFGMLCSEVELGLSMEAGGIMVLDKDTAIGEDIRRVLGIGGAVLDIDVLPNRIDILSIKGVAREVGAILNRKMKFPPVKVRELLPDAGKIAKIVVKEKKLCPRYMARVIRGVKIKTSPEWLQEKLLACGMRPVNNVVDVTNFVLLEMGQPLHAFDLNQLKERTVVVRKAAHGEKITTIDGEKRDISGCLVIADPERPVAVAGIMGALNTEVSDLTEDILLESAYFDPKTIHKAEKQLKLRTEASVRFDRGVDWEGVEEALDRASSLIADLANGKVLKGKIDIKSEQRKPASIILRLERVNRILGAKIKASEIRSIMSRLGFRLKGSKVEVPLFRAGDIEREIDLIEEIARIFGYGRIPVTLPDLKIKNIQEGAADRQIRRIKSMLVDEGLSEAITYSMLPPSADSEIVPPYCNGQQVRIMNPISEDLSVMRRGILPSLLRCLLYNINHQIEDVNIFEFGKIFFRDENGKVLEKQELAALFHGKRAYRYDGVKDAVDFFTLKKIAGDILSYLGVSYDIKENTAAGYHPGRSAAIIKEGKVIGVFGEIHPDISAKIGAKGPINSISLSLDDCLEIKKLPKKFKDIPSFPSSKRDIAMLVPSGVTNKSIISEIRASGGEIVEDVMLFDKYEGEKIEKGYYSLAYSIVYRNTKRTLTDEEVNRKHEEISANLAQKLGIKVRK